MRIVLAAFAAAAAAILPAHAGFEAAAQYNARLGGVSFVIVRAGAALFEDYPNGGAPDAAFDLASGTKSFSCAIAAAAVQDGLLDLDEKAAATLGEWRSDRLKSAITIRQILNLTSGIEKGRIGRAPTYAAAVAEPAIAAPGAGFAYGPVNFQIFGEIMRRKLDGFEGGRHADALSYLKARILDPLDIAPASWKRGADGHPLLPQGAKFTARDWARYGELILAKGQWNGAPLVDRAALEACFEGSAANPAYGLAFWLRAEPGAAALKSARAMTVATDLYTHPRRGELPADLVVAAGAGGQRMYAIPSQGLVVVRQYPHLVERRRVLRGGEFSDVEFLLLALDGR